MSSGKQSSSTTIQLPAWVDKGGQEVFQKAKEVASKPYQPYQGQRFAGFNPDQQDAFARTRASMGLYQPFLDEATGMVRGATQQFSNADAQRLMNPYTQQVGGILAREINRGFNQQLQANKDAALAAKAWGGSRHGVVDAETERNRGQALSDMWTNIASGAYDRALSEFGNERARLAQGATQMAGLGNQTQQQALADAAALAGIGREQRGLDQQYLDYLFSEYQRVQADPYERLNFLSGILAGTPYSQTTTQVGPGGSPWASALGLGMSALGTAGILGWI